MLPTQYFLQLFSMGKRRNQSVMRLNVEWTITFKISFYQSNYSMFRDMIESFAINNEDYHK